MDKSNFNSLLPTELKEAVFLQLPDHDMKTAVLVCADWRKVAENPKFWKWVKLVVNSKNLAVMPEIIGLARLSSMETLTVWAVSGELLMAIEAHPGIKKLDIKNINLLAIEPNVALLVRVFNKLEEVNIWPLFSIEARHWDAIFLSVRSSSKLKKINISNNDMSKAESEPMAQAICRMEEVNLRYTHLTTIQCETIFSESTKNSSKLAKLDISSNDISLVNPELLAKATCQMEEVNMSDTSMTTQQCETILESAMNSSKLVKLDITENDIPLVNPELLAKAVCQMEEVELSDTDMSTIQCEMIFLESAKTSSKLVKLNIEGNDLSLVSEIMGKAICKMKEVNLRRTSLTPQQCEEIFVECAKNSSKLAKLDIEDNDLSLVSPEIMGKAICKMEEVTMRDTHLTTQQCEMIFSESAKNSSKLAKLDISYNDIFMVNPDVLAKVTCQMEEVNMRCTGLTSQQCEEIFLECAKISSKLVKLDIEFNDLSLISPEIMGKAICKMKEVDLRSTGLTTRQKETIAEYAKKDTKLKI